MGEGRHLAMVFFGLIASKSAAGTLVKRTLESLKSMTTCATCELLVQPQPQDKVSSKHWALSTIKRTLTDRTSAPGTRMFGRHAQAEASFETSCATVS